MSHVACTQGVFSELLPGQWKFEPAVGALEADCLRVFGEFAAKGRGVIVRMELNGSRHEVQGRDGKIESYERTRLPGAKQSCEHGTVALSNLWDMIERSATAEKVCVCKSLLHGHEPGCPLDKSK